MAVTISAATGPDYHFYTMTDRRTWISAPTYTRTRHRYRGVRESWKLNLETYSFSFNVYQLNDKLTKLRDLFDQYVDLMLDGGTIALASPLVMEGTANLTSLFQSLERRITILEQE